MTQYKTTEPTFLFYDYETFGLHTSLDKPAQFACIRTDFNLHIIDDPKCFYCFPSDDYLPDPSTVLITRITPEHTKKYGTNEYFFSKKISNILLQPNTCIVGYNNIKFDDEITRNIFYRNFFDPYEWSWKNGNSRWDLLNIVRACYALRPHGIIWPKNKLGLPSFKLSDLTAVNNIKHINAHDAMSDVYATISIAKLIKNKQPKLFNFFFQNRKKCELYKFLRLRKSEPIIYVSSIFGAQKNNIGFIFPIAWNQYNQNVLIAIDLNKDIENLIFLCQTASNQIFLMKNLFNFGVIFLYINRCPILAPIQVIHKKDFVRLNCNISDYKKKINLLKNNQRVFKNIIIMLSKKNTINNSIDVDLQLYHSFFNIHDKKMINDIQQTNPHLLKNTQYEFFDTRLKKIFFRYRARNFYHTLNNYEKKIWLEHCFDKFNVAYLKSYEDNIQLLLKKNCDNEKNKCLLYDLLDYMFNKYKKFIFQYSHLN
ncbi:MAG: exodeoxyribonuclease I [Buchnera aphidicola (Pentalonia nigronervosa)]|jgi:exodeoxyribonuclease-1|uniref:Exodeoxyribonuclease I n=1 Tax=Buchnera aphidicola (Pentalonia nigronervosa) TaxID=1309793 RepID=A0A7H1AZ20_9GAMM|nr:MAG: exodeoxyribonuclease I [Buchnera aphidicola (Pentalonia nigronervosa)]